MWKGRLVSRRDIYTLLPASRWLNYLIASSATPAHPSETTTSEGKEILKGRAAFGELD
jgi:predicted patatin/cPLA2 family phospholipase